uniref:Secreted protein n=3 Tax=Neoaves TaxID=3078114 RepID=A0A663E7R3_AQUCH
MCHKMCNFFTFFPLYISYGFQLVHSKKEKETKQNSPLIFFNNCISAQVIHYSLQPCLCNLTSKCWQSKHALVTMKEAFYITTQ